MAEKAQSKKVKADVLKVIRYQPYKIAQSVGFKDFKEEVHNAWLKNFLFSKSKVYTLQAHRGSFKTTALSVAVALFMLLNPSKNIFLIRKTEGDVSTFTLQVKKILLSQLFQELSALFYERPLFFTKENEHALDTSLSVGPSGAFQFDTVSISGSLTGKHADIVITDDIVTIKDRVSRAEREHTKRQYMEVQNIVSRDGRIINAGTPWHKEDAFFLMGEPDRYDIRKTGLITKEEEERLRRGMSPSLFAANYELRHIADSDALFSSPKYFEGEEKEIFDGIAHIDAAYGGGDFTAFTIIKKLEDEFLVFGKLWGRHVDDCIPEILYHHKRLKAGTIYMERNADKGYLAKKIAEKAPVSSYQEKENKFIKISTYLRGAWDRVYFLDGTDDEYIGQILDYTEYADHDDSPDSLASAIRILDRGSPKVKLFKHSF